MNRVEKLKKYKKQRNWMLKGIIGLSIFVVILYLILKFHLDSIMLNRFLIVIPFVFIVIILLIISSIHSINKNFDRSILFFEKNNYLNTKEADLVLSSNIECVENLFINYDRGYFIDLQKHHDFELKTFVGYHFIKTYYLKCKDSNNKSINLVLDRSAAFFREEMMVYIGKI